MRGPILLSLIVMGWVQANTIRFCNDVDSTQCIEEDIVYGSCRTLPDSNAKGDDGSTYEVSPSSSIAISG